VSDVGGREPEDPSFSKEGNDPASFSHNACTNNSTWLLSVAIISSLPLSPQCIPPLFAPFFYSVAVCVCVSVARKILRDLVKVESDANSESSLRRSVLGLNGARHDGVVNE